jgi:hypothetical protein
MRNFSLSDLILPELQRCRWSMECFGSCMVHVPADGEMGFSTMVSQSLIRGAWVSFDGKAAQTPFIFQYNLYDNLSLAVDPSDKNHLFIGSAGSGLFEFKNDQVIAHYDTSNSPLQGQVGNLPQCRVHGIALDRDRNLWVSNAGVANVLKVLKNDGTWKSFSFLGAINSYSLTGDVLVDNNGFIWLTVFENTGGKEGILMFNPNFTIDNTSDDQFEIAEFGSNRVRCMAMDKEGTIWAGTEGGVYVFYPPSATPQQILIRQDNSYQYLLAAGNSDCHCCRWRESQMDWNRERRPLPFYCRWSESRFCILRRRIVRCFQIILPLLPLMVNPVRYM